MVAFGHLLNLVRVWWMKPILSDTLFYQRNDLLYNGCLICISASYVIMIFAHPLILVLVTEMLLTPIIVFNGYK